MSYKPLSQTVTDGQKNPISSDAVNDHVAAEIAAIPASASLTLDNLTAPTAVNQDLLLDAGKKIRLNASETVNTLLHVKSSAAVGTGVNAVTPSNTGSTLFNTSSSISAILSVGDYIKLNGLADIARVTVINSTTQITVSPSLGIGGGGTSREIEKIQTSATFRDASNVELFSVIDNKFKFGVSGNILLGDGVGDKISTATNHVIIGQNSGRAVTQGSNLVAIGAGVLAKANLSGNTGTGWVAIGGNAAASLTSIYAGGTGGATLASVIIGGGALQGSTNTDTAVVIGHLAASSAQNYSESVVIGPAAATVSGNFTRSVAIGRDSGNSFNGGQNTFVGVFAGVGTGSTTRNYNSGFGSESFSNSSPWFTRAGTVYLSSGSHNSMFGYASGVLNATTSHALALGGLGAGATSNNIAFGSVYSSYNAVYFGKGEYGVDRNGEESTSFKITTHRGRLTDQNCLGSLVVAGAAGTGTGLGSAVILSTAQAGAASGTSVNPHVARLRVEQDGRIGIGVQNPEAKLEVAGKTRLYDGDLEIASLGKGLKIAEGANATIGVVTLAAGTATVSTTAVKSNSRIMLTNQNPGGTVGFLHVSARTADTSFVITSSNAADTSDVAWMIVNPMTVTDSDADTFITNASITDATQKRAIQRLVKSLKDESLWAKMKVIYPMVGGTEAAHKLNLKDPQDTDAAFRLVFSNANVIHNERGIKFGGSNSPANADTKFVPNTHFTAVDDLHVSCYFYYDTDTYRGGPVIGATVSGATSFLFNPDNANASFTLNNVVRTMRTDVNNFIPGNRSKSNFMLMNSTSTDMRGYLRTPEKDLYEIWERSASAATGSMSTLSLVLNGYNNNGTPSSNWAYGTGVYKTMQFVTFGDSLSSLEAYKLHAIIEQFQLELSRQV